MSRYADELRSLALSFPEAYEDEPWGHPVFKVGDNRMFASMSEQDGVLQLTVKLTPEEREMAQLQPYVSTARWVDMVFCGTSRRRATSPAGRPCGSCRMISLKASSLVG